MLHSADETDLILGISGLNAEIVALQSLQVGSERKERLLHLLSRSWRTVLRVDRQMLQVGDFVESLTAADQDDIWTNLNEPVFKDRLQALQRDPRARMLQDIRSLEPDSASGDRQCFLRLMERLQAELYTWPENLLSWMAGIGKRARKEGAVRSTQPQSLREMLHYINVRNLPRVRDHFARSEGSLTFRWQRHLRPVAQVVRDAGLTGLALDELLDFELATAPIPAGFGDGELQLGVGEDGLLTLLRAGQSLARTLRARAPDLVDIPSPTAGNVRLLRRQHPGCEVLGSLVPRPTALTEVRQQRAAPPLKRAKHAASTVTTRGQPLPDAFNRPSVTTRGKPPPDASNRPVGDGRDATDPPRVSEPHASNGGELPCTGRTIMDRLHEDAAEKIDAVLLECEQVLHDPRLHVDGAEAPPGALKIQRLLGLLKERAWATGWWPPEDETAFGRCLQASEDADVHFYRAVTWKSARRQQAPLQLQRPTVVVDDHLAASSEELQRRFLRSLGRYKPSTNVEVQHAALESGDPEFSDLTRNIEIREALDLIKAPCDHISVSTWRRVVNLLNLDDLVHHQAPEFLEEADLLRTARAWAESFSDEAVGKYSAANDLGSNLLGCVSFVLYATRGSWSDIHLDILNGTWVRCLRGVKLWPMVLNMTEEDKAGLALLGSAWLPPAGKLKSLVLQPGYMLIMPAGVFIPHTPLTLHDCLMDGGMYWEEGAVLRILENMTFIFQNDQVTNEDPPRGLREALIGLKMIVLSRIQEGTWRSLEGSGCEDAAAYRMAFLQSCTAGHARQGGAVALG
ncbi:hypothetical protein LTR74_003356 [Friedmanniomyces endolithicus]|nr:hypothetical protein LTR74_003356 [Friedmanniomyces endolithicus]